MGVQRGVWDRELGFYPRTCVNTKTVSARFPPLADLQRLQLTTKLRHHTGCVNTLAWNQAGTLLLSGADDTIVGVWDATYKYRLKASVQTGHSRNIFGVQVVPESSDNSIVTCALDGEVRHTDIESQTNTLLAENEDMCLTVNFIPGEAKVFLSTQQDGTVRIFDLRVPPPHASHGNAPIVVQLGTAVSDLCFHPGRPNLFAVGCSDPVVRMFDLRTATSPARGVVWGMWAPKGSVPKDVRLPLPESTPSRISSRQGSFGLRMNNGASGLDLNAKGELVATYRGGDVYLFDATETMEPETVSTNTIMQYQGRRNEDTFLKQVRFLFHGSDEQVATGGDCGCVYVWHKKSGALLRRMQADSYTVNALAPHPVLPLLATSGIDHDTKVWECTAEEAVPWYYEETVCKPRSRPGRAGLRQCRRVAEEQEDTEEAAEHVGGSSQDMNIHHPDTEEISDVERDEGQHDSDMMGESSEDIESESEEEDVGHVDPEASESSIRNSILQRHLRRHAPAWLREAGPTSQVVTIAEAEQQLAQAETARQQGNTLFREKQVPRAGEEYDKALGHLKFHAPTSSLGALQTQAIVLCLLNQAACNLLLGQPRDAIEACQSVLRLQPSNVKALLRETQGWQDLERWEAAEEVLEQAAMLLGPDDADVRRLKLRLKHGRDAESRREHRMYQAMFSGGGTTAEDQQQSSGDA